jgi:hypothetical protein
VLPVLMITIETQALHASHVVLETFLLSVICSASHVDQAHMTTTPTLQRRVFRARVGSFQMQVLRNASTAQQDELTGISIRQHLV